MESLIHSESVSPIAVFAFRIFASIFLTVALVLWLMQKNTTSKEGEAKLPPGPKGFPFLGFLPIFTTITPEWLEKMKKKYGDIFSFKYSGYTTVFLGSHDLIKEALVTQGSNFAARTHGFTIFNWTLNNSGILSADGKLWQEHRRFVVQVLRDFGMGRSSLEGQLIDEAQSIVTRLKSTQGKRVDVLDWLAKSSMNLTTKMIYNETYDFEDPEFLAIYHHICQMVKSYDGFDMERPRLISKFFPWILIRNGRNYKKNFDELVNRIVAKFVEHEKTFDENHIRDYFDAHISKRKQAESSGDMELADFYTGIHAGPIAASLMLAASQNMPQSAYWGLYFLANHPEVQKKMQKELHEVIGRDRNPSFTDLPNLPYTEAVINETYRLADLISINFLHENYEEANVAGYKIPKRSVIIPSLNSLHRDTRYWSNPTSFNPEHFLDSEGKKIKTIGFMPFSVGRRLCPGENVSRAFLFHVLTSIMQNFSLQYPEDQKAFPGNFHSATNLLNPYHLVVVPRTLEQ